ncbi:undecaprenyl-phosphate glucose phosphotransferase [Acidocella aquatica]|uniref:Undecaprenyl-phosphate glucose phosphotransferase n=1 Tax=Acidocella aquatica TaxID=1922313 RepID=A0ABQ6A8J9_9PROT|nr:undecaprenyl-phosphate glucose phosphotransferase [Acidocella aquatica]
MIIPLTGSLLRQSTENLERNLCFWILLAFISVMLIASHGGYRASQPSALRKQTGLAINCFYATSITMLSLAVLMGYPHILARPWTAADLIVTPFILSGFRTVLAERLTASSHEERASSSVIVCYDHCPQGLAQALNELQISSRIAGVLYLSPRHVLDSLPNWAEVPDIQALLKMIRAKNVQDIIFVHHPALDTIAATLHQELFSDLLAYPARIWMAFDIASNLPELLKSQSGSCKIVPIVTNSMVSSLNVTKRAFDLILALGLLVLVSPVLLISACLIKMSSPGPFIFRQTRTGAQGQQFTVLKFRTMTYDPDRPFAQAQRQDPRVTVIGHFLRRTSLDELLQLINVIKGDMSLVGPRPHAPETKVEGITFENALRLYRLRHRVKPGITGLAQIRGQRGETRALSVLEQRLASDIEYIQSWSVWLDIFIIIQTLPTLLMQTNAW